MNLLQQIEAEYHSVARSTARKVRAAMRHVPERTRKSADAPERWRPGVRKEPPQPRRFKRWAAT